MSTECFDDSDEGSDTFEEHSQTETETESSRTKYIKREETNDSLLKGLKNGKYSAQFPMEKDEAKHTSDAFNVLQLIYKDNSAVSNWFQCSVCNKLLNVLRNRGTQPLLRHPCVKKWRARNKTEKERLLQIKAEDLGDIFSKVLTIGKCKSPVNSRQIIRILPKTSTQEQWKLFHNELDTIAGGGSIAETPTSGKKRHATSELMKNKRKKKNILSNEQNTIRIQSASSLIRKDAKGSVACDNSGGRKSLGELAKARKRKNRVECLDDCHVGGENRKKKKINTPGTLQTDQKRRNSTWQSILNRSATNLIHCSNGVFIETGE